MQGIDRLRIGIRSYSLLKSEQLLTINDVGFTPDCTRYLIWLQPDYKISSRRDTRGIVGPRKPTINSQAAITPLAKYPSLQLPVLSSYYSAGIVRIIAGELFRGVR